MKRLRSIGLLMTFLFLGLNCKKETSSVPFQGYLRFNLDGVPIVCNNIYPSFIHKPDQSFVVYGDWAGGEISLQLYDDSLLSARRYPFEKDEFRRATLWINVAPGVNNIFSAGGVVGTLYGSGHITVSEVKDQFIKGSFDFTTNRATFDSSVKTVTNGEFHLQRR